jgi:hypothetical protein
MIANESSSLVRSPKFMVPSTIRETDVPVRPRCVYFMGEPFSSSNGAVDRHRDECRIDAGRRTPARQPDPDRLQRYPASDG